MPNTLAAALDWSLHFTQLPTVISNPVQPAIYGTLISLLSKKKMLLFFRDAYSYKYVHDDDDDDDKQTSKDFGFVVRCGLSAVRNCRFRFNGIHPVVS